MNLNDYSQNINFRKSIIIIRPIMTIARYHYLRTMELSKYYNIIWFVGYHLNEHDNDLIGGNEHHKVIIAYKNRKKSKNPIVNNLVLFLFYFKAALFLKRNKTDLVIVHNNRFGFLLPLIHYKNKLALQLSTSMVVSNSLRRKIGDFIDIQINLFFYKRFIVGTEWMINKFNLNTKNTITTRWGSSPISDKQKSFSDLKLFYIGSLTNRNIHETVIGLGLFVNKYRDKIKITYDIVGSGSKQYTELIKNAIDMYNLSEIVQLHGYIEDKNIKSFFDNCNIGVSYIPITTYFNNVVASKTDEYLLSGLAIIATETEENIKVVNDKVGVLIKDNPESFCKGLEKIVQNLDKYSSDTIQEEVRTISLEYTITHNIIPAYNSIL